VVLREGQSIAGVKDSKQLSSTQRIKLLPSIHQESAFWVLARSSSRQIDRYSLSACWKACAVECALRCYERFSNSTIIIDGDVRLPYPIPKDIQIAVKKADVLMPAVSAASVLAKVYRDDYMVELAEKYPSYHFEKHKGYYTDLHRATLEELGPCPQHRYSTIPVRRVVHKRGTT
jgi:ribonuclease HII